MDAEGIDHHKNDAHDRNENHINGSGNESLYIAADFLQFAESLAAALVLEYLVGQIQGMPDPIGVHPCAQALHDYVDEIVLEVLGHTRHKRHAHRRQ